MNGIGEAGGIRAPDEAVAAKAARWLARLRSPECTAGDREGFQRWLARDPRHWQAYNETERAWTRAAALAEDPELRMLADDVLRRAVRRRIAPPLRGRRWLGASAALVAAGALLAAVLLPHWPRPASPPPTVYGTGIGEIRSFTLADHSVVTLDTDTLMEVRMDEGRRELELLRGKAQFDVAHDQARPFAVRAGQVVVTALGTVFQVKSDPDATEVALLEGRVRVAGATPATRARMRELAAGETLLAADTGEWRTGALSRDVATGWLTGRIVFDSVPLHAAVAEFNRYSRKKLRLEDADIAGIEIHGVFNAGDPQSISLALEYAYPILAEDRGNDVVLTRRAP